MISRRKFIHSSNLAGAAVFSGLSLHSTGCVSANRCIQLEKKHKYVLADIHNHLIPNDWHSRTPMAMKTPALDFLARTLFNKMSTNLKTAHEAGIDLICVTHYNVFDEGIGMPVDPNPAAPINILRMMDLLEEESNSSSYHL